MSQFRHFKIAECQLPTTSTRGSWNCFYPTNDDDVDEDDGDDNSDEDEDGDEDDDA